MKLKLIIPFGSLSLVFLLGVACTAQPDSNATTTGTTSASVSPTPDASPTAANSPNPPTSGMKMAQKNKVLAEGKLVDGEHPTSGRVQIVQQGKKRVLTLGADFKTSEMGPDLVVILHRSTDVIGSTVPPAYPIKEGDYVLLAPLKGFAGAQSYTIPATINLADYPSAAIWCRKFNATFGAARLKQS